MVNIKGLDYNTDRKKLVMPEYGREIQKMVEYALSLKDRAERQHCAETIVMTMKRMVPQEGTREDQFQKLWNHLAVMSNFELDIDYPVDIEEARHLGEKPNRLEYNRPKGYTRHYGQMLAALFEKLKTMPEGAERDALVADVANQMKRCLVQWGHGSSDDEKVADDLARYTDGVIQLDLSSFRFERISAENRPQQEKKRRKK